MKSMCRSEKMGTSAREEAEQQDVLVWQQEKQCDNP